MSTPGHSDRADGIRWEAPGDRERAKFYQLLRPRVGERLKLIILTEYLLGVYQHYDGQNSIPCIGRENRCLPCEAGISWRWYGYFGVVTPGTGKQAILQLTRGAYESCVILHSKDRSFRGHYIDAWRTGRAINAPVNVALGRLCDLNALPPAFDVKEALLRLWGIRGGSVPGGS